MRGEAELALRGSRDPEEYRRVLATNLDEIARLSGIIDQLLTLSKADVGQASVLFEKIDLHEVMGELYEDCEIIATKKQISVELLGNEHVSIEGDRGRLRQLFLNLIDNAVKYTPERGKVSLSLERRDGFALVRVKDTGIGIPKAEQPMIFDRFYRVDKARSRDFGGSGLGLAIVKWIVDLHKGRIEVESEPNKGSTFTVALPVGDQRSAPTEK
jgi:signal transduction histidine kinase